MAPRFGSTTELCLCLFCIQCDGRRGLGDDQGRRDPSKENLDSSRGWAEVEKELFE